MADVPEAFAEAFAEPKDRVNRPTRQIARPETLPGQMVATGWVAPKGRISFERYEVIGQMILDFRQATAWAMGDWLVEARNRFGEKYSQLIPAKEREMQTWKNWMSVSENWPREQRRVGLPWTIHQELTPLDEKTRTRYLDLVEAEGLTREELRNRLEADGMKTPRAPKEKAEPEPICKRCGMTCVSCEQRDVNDQAAEA